MGEAQHVKAEEVALIGREVAIRWSDGQEDFFEMERLRALSPSAETQGEVDILGQKHGGTSQKSWPGVVVRSYEVVGTYALRFIFSDGHNTGIYSFDYLRRIARVLRDQASEDSRT
jgi:DUF971 family protein